MAWKMASLLERRKGVLGRGVWSVRSKSVWPSGKDPTAAGSSRFPDKQRLFARCLNFSASVRGPRGLLASICIGTGPDGMGDAAELGAGSGNCWTGPGADLLADVQIGGCRNGWLGKWPR